MDFAKNLRIESYSEKYFQDAFVETERGLAGRHGAYQQLGLT